MLPEKNTISKTATNWANRNENVNPLFSQLIKSNSFD